MTTAVVTRDERLYLERALALGCARGLFDASRLARMQEEGAKALVQIADYFGSAYLRPHVETALTRFVNLASLYLETHYGDDLLAAAYSLRDHTLLYHSRGGSEMLKRLHALPASTELPPTPPTVESQRDFLERHSLATPLTAASYRQQWAERSANQQQIAFACWLGQRLGAEDADLAGYTAEAVIRSALLVCIAGRQPLRLPTRTELVQRIVRLQTAAPHWTRWTRLLASAPPEHRPLGAAAQAEFTAQWLPKLRSVKPEALLAGPEAESFWSVAHCAEEAAAYERLVAKEWFKITRGRDDEQVLATVFLTLAAGMPPKRALLQREAKELIAAVRAHGCNAARVADFIARHAPLERQPEWLSLWQDELLPEACAALTDPEDEQMTRALAYLRERCVAKWGKSRRSD